MKPDTVPTRAGALDALEQGAPGALDAFRARVNAPEASPDARVRALVDLGLALLHAPRAAPPPEHLREALDALSRAVALAPEDLPARLALARALESMRSLDEAVAALTEAARLASLQGGDARVERELGAILYRRRRYDSAAEAFSRAWALAPDARTAYDLGLARDALRDPGGAIGWYREALRLDPAFVPARVTLADALAMVGEHRAALEALDAVLLADPSHPHASRNREVLARALAAMESHRLLGRPEGALRRSALMEAGRHVPAHAVERPSGWRYASRRSDVYAFFEGEGEVRAALLAFPDPGRAAALEDDRFNVTVVDARGGSRPADYATAASLTFLKELAGVTLTEAAGLYRRLLSGEPEVRVGDALARFDQLSIDQREVAGLYVTLR